MSTFKQQTKKKQKPLPANLQDFLRGLQTMSGLNLAQDEILSHIRNFAFRMGLKVYNAEHAITEKIQFEQKKIKGPVTKLVDGTHKLELSKILIEGTVKSIKTESRRVIISNDKQKMPGCENNTLYYECNGLILDAITWQPLVIPPRAFNKYPKTVNINNYLAENVYDIVRVEDGTVVTLYNWNSPDKGRIWSIATSAGYDVSSLKWMGDKTYAEIFYYIAQKYYSDFVKWSGMTLEIEEDKTRLAFTNLDPSGCHSIGFRYHGFHPVISDFEKMWHVQSVIKGKVVRGNLSYLPQQQKIDIQDCTVEVLKSLCKKSVEDAVKSIANKDPNASFNYGYILRSKNPKKTREYSDILIDSPLLKCVRQLFYNHHSEITGISPMEKMEYTAMRIFLLNRDRVSFLSLCPDWSPRFLEYEALINNIIDLIVTLLRQSGMASCGKISAPSTPIARVAQGIMNHMTSRVMIPEFNKDVRSIVSDFVTRQEYSPVFIKLLQRK